MVGYKMGSLEGSFNKYLTTMHRIAETIFSVLWQSEYDQLPDIVKIKALFLFWVGGLLFQKDCAANYLFYPNTENKLTVLYILVSFLVISP